MPYLFALVALIAMSQPPLTPEQVAILTRIHEVALSYTERLQDFTCTQNTVRSGAKTSNPNKWKQVDTQESELNFVSHKEHYRLLKVNGSADRPQARIAKGYTRTSGEFGTLMRSVFRPESKARFEWRSRADNVCAFNYEILVENSTMTITTGTKRIPLAFGGTVYANCDTGKITRINAVSRGVRPDEALSADVDYGPTKIGDREFFLPIRAVSTSRHGNTVTKAEIKFTNYRKYDAASTLKFDEEEPK